MIKIAILGGGLSGLVASLACQNAGFQTTLISRSFEYTDGRTTALFMPSINFLDSLNSWADVRHLCNPLQTMRIIDGTQRLIRARPAIFQSTDIGLDTFGYNIPNSYLLDNLAQQAKAKGVTFVKGEAASLTETDDKIRLQLTDGQDLEAQFMIAADGKQSRLRQLAGINHKMWAYQQKAIVLTFQHKFPHQNISTEFHTKSGPFTQVPLPGNRSSLVWAVKDGEEEAVLDKNNDSLNHIIETKMQSILGKVQIDSTLQAFPLTSLLAQQFAKGRVLLVGEAAHAFPPIGAQGLNLGLRDIMDLVECLMHARNRDNFGNLATDYHRARQKDIIIRTFAVDMFNRSLLTSFLPAHLARVLALSAAGNIPVFKQFLMRQGAGVGVVSG